MSEISDMIQRLCPDGVEYRKLGEVGSFYAGLSGKCKDDFKDGNAMFINYLNVYSNPSLNLNVQEKVRIYNGEKQNIIQKGDILFTGSSETPDECGMSSVVMEQPCENAYLNSFCFGLRLFNPERFDMIYLKHLLRSTEIRKLISGTASGVTRFNVSKKRFSMVSIPVPPIEIQRKIGEVLDNFSELTAELTAELEARKKQYEYYRDNLLNFSQIAPNSVKWMKMSEVGTFTRGRRFVRADIVEQGYPCIHYGDMYTYYGLSATETKTYIPFEVAKKLRFAQQNDVVIVGAGENDEDIGIGVAWLGDSSPAVHDACYIFHHNQNPKFISHYLRTSFYHKQIKTSVSSGKICSISAEGIGKALIPIPPLSEQERIVSILDRFESLTTDLTSGLPAEIKARQQQYEYYRDQLLTFKRAN